MTATSVIVGVLVGVASARYFWSASSAVRAGIAYASHFGPLRARTIMSAMSTIGRRDAVRLSAPTRALNPQPDDLMSLCDAGQDLTTGSVQDRR